jgi:hypothetical protein
LRPIRSTLTVASVLSVCVMAGHPVFAQQAATPGKIGLELNTINGTDKACRFSFVISNEAGHDVEKLAAEFAFFDKGGLLTKLSVFNFGSLPQGRTQVRQFEIPGAGCETYSRLLLNTVKSCDGFGDGLVACEAAIQPSNKTTMEFGK